jgi:hypothetical protein
VESVEGGKVGRKSAWEWGSGMGQPLRSGMPGLCWEEELV